MTELKEFVIFYCLLAIVLLFLVISFTIIWYYISKKPLGMQTVYDKIIKDLLVVSTLAFIGAILPTLVYGITPPWLASCLVCFNFLTVMAILVHFFLVMVVRYMSIFHGHIMMEMNEATLIPKTRGLLFLVIAALFTFDVISSDSTYGPLYNFLVNGEYENTDKPYKPYLFKVMVAIDLIFIVVLQVKVEQDSYRLSETTVYDKSTVRTVICIVGGLFLVILFILPWNYSHGSRVRMNTVITTSLVFNVIPMVFIIRNENMKKFIASRWATWIASFSSHGNLSI